MMMKKFCIQLKKTWSKRFRTKNQILELQYQMHKQATLSLRKSQMKQRILKMISMKILMMEITITAMVAVETTMAIRIKETKIMIRKILIMIKKDQYQKRLKIQCQNKMSPLVYQLYFIFLDLSQVSLSQSQLLLDLLSTRNLKNKLQLLLTKLLNKIILLQNKKKFNKRLKTMNPSIILKQTWEISSLKLTLLITVFKMKVLIM